MLKVRWELIYGFYWKFLSPSSGKEFENRLRVDEVTKWVWWHPVGTRCIIKPPKLFKKCTVSVNTSGGTAVHFCTVWMVSSFAWYCGFIRFALSKSRLKYIYCRKLNHSLHVEWYCAAVILFWCFTWSMCDQIVWPSLTDWEICFDMIETFLIPSVKSIKFTSRSVNW